MEKIAVHVECRSMRTALVGLVAAALSAAPAPTAQARVEPFLPVGVWYLEPAREGDGWRRDLQSIRSLGFNTITTRVDWAASEPERGRYRFDALERMMSLAEETGLKVIVQIDADDAPGWLASRYADGGLVNERGTTVRTGSPRFCLDHPGVRQDTVSFIAAAAARAATFRAFYGIDVWGEAHPAARAAAEPAGEFCYCANTVRRYREWLRQGYGTLEAFNAARRRTFASWDDVSPPASSAIAARVEVLEWR